MGQGNYGKVARAKYHSPDGRQLTCVVKVIGRQNETEDDAKLFEREVMALSKAKHQRIVQMWEHFKFSRAYIITMEYCPRGTLDTLLGELPQGQYFSHDFAFLFCKDLASALHFLHEKNIVHRDLKPENVLFDRNKRLKLADFGFAKKLTSRSMRNTICFSEAFCAPELLRSPSPHHDPKKLDVSGYGLLCYLVFTTKLPFQLEVIKPRDEFAPLPPLDITPKLKWEHQKGTIPGSFVSTLKYSLKAEPATRTTMCTIQGQPWYGEVIVPRDQQH